MSSILRHDLVVVDAGIVFRALVPNPQQVILQQKIDGWRKANVRLHAPTLFLYEVTSAISKSHHFGQLTEHEAQTALKLVQHFDIELHVPDVGMVQSAFEWTLRLKRASAYDSFYLALARSLSCALWTLDQRLKNAVDENWIILAHTE